MKTLPIETIIIPHCLGIHVFCRSRFFTWLIIYLENFPQCFRPACVGLKGRCWNLGLTWHLQSESDSLKLEWKFLDQFLLTWTNGSIKLMSYTVCVVHPLCYCCNMSAGHLSKHWRCSMLLNFGKESSESTTFFKSGWRHSVIDLYDKDRNSPYFAPWHLGDKLGVYRWPQCNYISSGNFFIFCKKLPLEIGARVDGHGKTWEIRTRGILICLQ